MSNDPTSPAAAGSPGAAGGSDASRLVYHTISHTKVLSDVAVSALTEHAILHANDNPVRGVRRFRRDWIVEKKRGDDYTSEGRKPGSMIVKFSNRSRYRLLHMAKNCNADFRSMLTITYPKEFPRDGIQVKRDLDQFKKFLRKTYPNIMGLWFLEFQKRGAPHFHFLLDLNLSLRGSLVRKHRTRLHKSHGSESYQTHPDTEERASLAWFRIVGSGDERHLRAGVCWEALESEEAALRYAAKHAAKPHQKDVPKEFTNVGRFWGKLGDLHLEGGEDLDPITTEDIFRYVGTSALSTNGRVKKYLFDASTRVFS
jgi:hypothetical protein